MLREDFRGVDCGDAAGEEPVRSTTPLVFALVEGKLYMSAKDWVLVQDSGLSAGCVCRLRFADLLGVDGVPASALCCEEVKISAIDLGCLLALAEVVASFSSSFRLPFAFVWLLRDCA